MRNAAFLKWVLVAAILIVLNLFFTYAITSVYPAKRFEDFCPARQVSIPPTSEAECVAQGGAWTAGPPFAPDGGKLRPEGFCDVNFTCQRDFSDAQRLYNRNVFVARVVLGVLSILAGFAAATYDAVSLGFSFGGVLSLIVGTIGYWSDMNDSLRAIVLGFALLVLIWLGVKKLQPTATRA